MKYTLFALVATLFNLLFQFLSHLAYSNPSSLYVAMFFGTLAGLVAKYILDKKYIFYHTAKNRRDNAGKFVLYSLMGVLTTIIFWGTEIAFDALSQSPYAKYLGAVIGLSIGYILKYFLDKKYVFIHKEEVAV